MLTLYLHLTEVECDGNFIGEKLQEQLDSRETLVVVNSRESNTPWIPLTEHSAIHLVDESLVPMQTLYLRLTEVECDVNFTGEKRQGQLDSRETLVVVDSKGMEIHDTPGTQCIDDCVEVHVNMYVQLVDENRHPMQTLYVHLMVEARRFCQSN